MTQGAVAIGYHGCDRETGERFLAGEIELCPSTNDYDWLADGIYLWESDEHRALHWARSVMSRRKMSRASMREPFVLGVVVDMGNCLDLLQAQAIRLVSAAYHEMKASYGELGREIPTNTPVNGELVLRQLDCAVVQYLHQRRTEGGLPEFNTVRAAFPEGSELYPGAGFQERTHIQICVRHPRQIIGCFRPKMRH